MSDLDGTAPAYDDARRTLDGNAAAGALQELFGLDLTRAACTCGSCGATAALGAHLLYADAPAMVLRCPGCTGVVLRYGTTAGPDGRRLRLDLTGTRLLVLDPPDA